MGLRIVYGRAGTGKSKFCLDEIKQKVKNQMQKIYIIVPEQFSYATEKKLLETLEEGSVVNAEVISFKRLAYRINSEVGDNAKINLTKAGKAMLIENIVNKNKNNLNFLNKTNEIDLILRTITELKKHNINEEQLKLQIDNKLLELKLKDINTIFEEYQNTIKNSYIDEEDKLDILVRQIEKSNLLNNSIVYIDEFSGFTVQEYLVIEEILKKAKMVTVTICTDEFKNTKQPENDVFYPNKLTIKKLIEHAKNVDAKIEKEINLNQTHRFKTEELEFLEKNIYNTKNEVYKSQVEHIHLNLYNNPYEEIEETAKKIIHLVRTKNIRFRDISIIAKNIEDYISIVNAIFSKYNIPVFIDSNKELNDNILVKYVLSIFDVFAKGWSKDSVITYIKTGFTMLSKEDIYNIENYVSKWQIRGNKWYKEDWKYDSLNKDLEHLNILRRQVVEPLQKLNSELKNNKTAEEISKKLYEFLERNEIKNKINEKLNKIQNEEYSKEYISSYNILIDILDEITVLFGTQKFTFEQYSKILKAGLEVSNFGEIPEVIDAVNMGDVERSRSHKINTIFILGLNDGVFPSSKKDEGFLNDNDREILKQNGIELAKGTIENLYDEEFNIYKTFATAENEMYLSYVSSDKEGKAIRPSTLISKLKKIFPKLKEDSSVLRQNTEITTSNSTFTNLLYILRKLQNKEEIDAIWASVYNWYKENEKWKEKLSLAIKGFEDKNKAERISEKNIKRLYGDTLKTSISRLEQYKKCPFSFHLKYGLKLKEKEELKIKPVDTGSFMHEVINTFFENTENIKTITEEEIEKKIENIINEKLNLSKNYIFKSTPKFVVLTNRLKKVVLQSIKYIVFQIQNSDFNIVGNEIEFKRKIDNIEILGKIDRLDELNSEEGKYLRIIDYKSSEKNIDLNEFLSGIQIQLITYLDSSVEQTKNAMPAGMLYFKMIDPILKESRNKTDEQIAEELKKKFRMNGMILADVNIIKKMDKTLEKGSSNLLPVYLDKEGNISKTRSNVVTKEEFTILQKRAQKIIKEIAKEILSGNIDIRPMYSKKKKEDSCKYCEYKSICRFNPKVNSYSFIENKTKEEILEELKRKENI